MDLEEIVKVIEQCLAEEQLSKLIEHIAVLESILKRDKQLVTENLDGFSSHQKQLYIEVLNYLDGATYFSKTITESGDDLEQFAACLRLGWTPETYDDFKEFRALPYRDPLICETTDYWTFLSNELEDSGCGSLKEYVESVFGDRDAYYQNELQGYYLENMLEAIQKMEH